MFKDNQRLIDLAINAVTEKYRSFEGVNIVSLLTQLRDYPELTKREIDMYYPKSETDYCAFCNTKLPSPGRCNCKKTIEYNSLKK